MTPAELKELNTPAVICRLCDPRATAATTTYCDRCSPPVPSARPACVGCGQPLLLVGPGRVRCAACQLGRSHAPLPVHPPRPECRETCGGCGAFTATADGLCLGCRAGGGS